MKADTLEELKFNSLENEWKVTTQNISPENSVELSLCVTNKDENIDQKIDLVKEFSNNYDEIMCILYQFIFQKYSQTKFNKSIEELRRMYFLSGVSLKKDNNTWWVILEPSYDVETIYNHFLRFTMVDKKIIWSNLD